MSGSDVGLRSITSFPVFVFWIPGTRLVPPGVKEAYYVHVTASLAGVEAFCFSATFQLNRSDERQRSGRMKVVGRWFESGVCVRAFRAQKPLG